MAKRGKINSQSQRNSNLWKKVSAIKIYFQLLLWIVLERTQV